MRIALKKNPASAEWRRFFVSKKKMRTTQDLISKEFCALNVGVNYLMRSLKAEC